MVASYGIGITNASEPSCGADLYYFDMGTPPSGIAAGPAAEYVLSAPGVTGYIDLRVLASDDPEPGTYKIPFRIWSLTDLNGVPATLDFTLAPSPCRIRSSRELMITDLSVVRDASRTSSDGPADDSRTGAWTFKRLVENIASTPETAPAMVEQMLATFSAPQTINGFTVPARDVARALVLDRWPRTPDGRLDLARAPLRLEAIVNRLDLRNLAQGDAGEGRFVFSFLYQSAPLSATMIFEYKLPAASDADVLDWAKGWHALGALAFPSEGYNAALQALTDRFVARGARPDRPNGSALSTVRTNEIAFGSDWSFREFKLSAADGSLATAALDLTPDETFAESPLLASYINDNESLILANLDVMPLALGGQPFLAGSVPNPVFWEPPGVSNPEALFQFSIQTCSGCHSNQTGTIFQQILPDATGGEARLSRFLTGFSAVDAHSSAHLFNELARRQADIKTVICPNGTPMP